MVINQATKQLQIKIVFYGQALCGKTTNLEQVHANVQGAQEKGKLVSLATSSDRTLFFDFLPIEAMSIKGFKTKFQLYTVPGQVIYNTTRQLVLRGVDGIVFVADAQQFTSVLNDLLERSEASAALLVEKAGHLLHQCGQNEQFNAEVMATLASNSFNAVQFMAGLMGEANFPGMYQQGENFSTLMLNVDEHCILVIIFKAQVSVGAVKHFAGSTIKALAEQIRLAEQRAPGAGFDLTDLDVTSASELFKKKM